MSVSKKRHNSRVALRILQFFGRMAENNIVRKLTKPDFEKKFLFSSIAFRDCWPFQKRLKGFFSIFPF